MHKEFGEVGRTVFELQADRQTKKQTHILISDNATHPSWEKSKSEVCQTT